MFINDGAFDSGAADAGKLRLHRPSAALEGWIFLDQFWRTTMLQSVPYNNNNKQICITP